MMLRYKVLEIIADIKILMTMSLATFGAAQ